MSKKWILTFLLCFSFQWAFADGDREAELIKHVNRCFNLAEKMTSGITDPAILNIQGMSGHKGRHFLNNLCSLPHASYLEIGTWKGSTFISALYGNQQSIDYALAVDNWSEWDWQWGDSRKEFLENVNRFLPQGSFHFVEDNCFMLNKRKHLPLPVNIYFYDGEHRQIDQELAFTYFNDAFDDVFIAIVDDWNHPPAQEGTKAAFAKLNYEILFEREIFTSCQDERGWWNGIYVAVIKKPK